MHALIIVCFVTIAFAAPQYSYDQQAGQTIDGSTSELTSSSSSGGSFQTSQPTQIIYNKQFYIHSAPDDTYDVTPSNQLDNISLKRNLRVIFIKSPENKGLENAALQLAKTAGEDQTAIYVLNKQTDLSDLQNKLSQIQDLSASRPEVHFVKYRTPQEAEHAQHAIQAQYDQLGGSTQVSNEGVAPVQNFIGSKGALGTGSISSSAYLPPVFRL